MPALSPVAVRAVLVAALAVAATAAHAQTEGDDPAFPTTEFADGAKSASVTSEGVTAGVSFVRRPDIDPAADVAILSVIVDGKRVLEVPGVASGFDFPAAEASIANIDPANARPEVYFTSYSGGAHCCSTVIVATEFNGKWIGVTVGEFDGDGNYLEDLNDDGVAEIVTVDNRFLYKFDCYACSAAPLKILTVRGDKVVDVSTEQRFLQAHRDWLKEIEDGVDPAERWTSPGFLAGWVAAKIRVGEGAEAWKALDANWKLSSDEGEQVCTTGADPEDCAKADLKLMKFPDRLKLFLQQSGY